MRRGGEIQGPAVVGGAPRGGLLRLFGWFGGEGGAGGSGAGAEEGESDGGGWMLEGPPGQLGIEPLVDCSVWNISIYLSIWGSGLANIMVYCVCVCVF